MKPTAVVIDDDLDLLNMTVSYLESLGVEVVAKCRDSETGLNHLREHRPDLAVIDVLIPIRPGLEILEIIRSENFPTRVIMVSGHEQESWVQRAMDSGAVAYLRKPFIPELGDVVNRVLRGEMVLSPWALEVVARDYRRLRNEERTKIRLTPAETAVLQHRVSGKCCKEIAVALRKSPKTVEKQTTSLRKKIGAETEADLVRYALKNGLATL